MPQGGRLPGRVARGAPRVLWGKRLQLSSAIISTRENFGGKQPEVARDKKKASSAQIVIHCVCPPSSIICVGCVRNPCLAVMQTVLLCREVGQIINCSLHPCQAKPRPGYNHFSVTDSAK